MRATARLSPTAASARLALTLVIVVGPWSPLFGRIADDRYTRTIALATGASLTLEATQADVQLVGSARRDVRIDVVRHAPSIDALARFPVIVDSLPTGAHISVEQIEGGTDAELTAEIVLSVPSDARIDRVHIGEGRLDVRAFHGRLTADVRRGSIRAANVSGVLRLETVIGDLSLTAARLTPNGLLRLRAFNGDVSLTLAERPRDARIMALALNGTIRSTIPLTMKEGWGPRWGEATLGVGEPVVSLDVVTGRITLDAPRASP